MERIQKELLLKYLRLFPVVAVVGPRQVGKSTLVQLKEIGKEREYYTLDDFSTLGLAEKEPLALTQQENFITIDEVQKCPELIVEIKKQVDKKRINGKYLLTGSADLSFFANLAKILSSRVGIIELTPLSWWEIEKKDGIPWIISCLDKKKYYSPKTNEVNYIASLEKVILKGGYPIATLSKTIEDANIWHESHKQTYLEKEIRQFTEILHLSEFAKLLTLCSARTGCLLNQADLARDAALSPMTLNRYLNLLEATYQIKRIQPYFSNISKSQVKSPKLFWYDTGVATHLIGLNSFQALKKNNYFGQMLETFVIIQIDTYLKAFKPQARLYFWRTHAGQEIDGLIIDGIYKLPFEVKASSSLAYKDADAMRYFMQNNENCIMGIVFYLGNEMLTLGKNIWGMPVSVLVVEK